MTDELSRFLSLEGCANFRDLGGYPVLDGRTVKWRVLFRSDGQHEMTPEDVRLAESSLGIVTVIDLRNNDEAERDGISTLAESGVQYHRFGLLEGRGITPPMEGEDPAERLSEVYQWILYNSGRLAARTVDAIARQDGRSTVFHCSAGKDRTGIIAALVLGVLGVDDETVMADYLLTNEVIDDIFERIRRMQPNNTSTRSTLRAQPLAMERFLASLHADFGGAESYLRSHGLPGAIIGRLRSSLLG